MKYIKNNTQKRFALNAIMLCSGMLALSPIAAVNAADVKESKEEVEVITVTGIMSSIKKSLAAKQAADQIKDVISAEDIGKLPDQNLAEALQRVTGVQIGRDFGEGTAVSVRGMAQNRVEINGQTMMGSNSESRSISFNDLAPDAFSSMEVIKTPTADMTEGSLGATINLKSRRAFDSNKMILSATVKTEYLEAEEDYSPSISAFFSNRWDTPIGEMGLALSVNHSDKTLRRDTFESRWGIDSGQDVDGDGNKDAVYVPRQTRDQYWLRNQERSGMSANLQWQANENLEIYFDGNYSKLDKTTTSTTLSWNGDKASTVTNAVFNDNDTLLSGDLNKSAFASNGWNQLDDRESYGAAAGFKYFYQENWFFSGSVSKSYGEQKVDNAFLSMQNKPGSSALRLNYDAGDTEVIAFEMTDSNGASIDFLDPTVYKINSLVIQDMTKENDNTEIKFDVDYSLDYKDVSSIEFGVRSAERSAYRQRNRLQGNNLKGDALADHPNLPLYEQTYPDNFLSGISGGMAGIENFVAIDAKNIWGSDRGLFESEYGVNFATDGVDEFITTYDIVENTNAVYLKSNFDGEFGEFPYTANVGVRYVNTDITSAGWQGEAGAYEWQKLDHDYSDVLPSANIQFALTDKFLLRFAASKVMSRPNIVDLSTATKLNQGDLTAKSGNSELKPFRASQYDVSFEWYGDDNDFISAALFYKDVESYITSSSKEITKTPVGGEPTVYLLSLPGNGEGGTVKGAELAVTKTFGFLGDAFKGLGLSANYTYADSETPLIHPLTGAAMPLEDLSKDSYNIIGFYELDKFSTRLAYNWRSEFLDRTSGFYGQPEFEKARGQLDWSATYRITNKIRVTFNAINLNDSYRELYSSIEERPFKTSISGRRFNLGISAKF